MIEPLNECQRKLRQAEIELELEKDHIKQLEKLLNHNPDTGLMQRHILTRRLNTMVNSTRKPFAFGILRLDKNYQRIRHTRDRMKVLLYVSSERLKSLVGEDNLYQSDRSDEFLFIIPDISDEKAVEKRIQQMIMKISESHQHPATDVNFSCNVGVALYPKTRQGPWMNWRSMRKSPWASTRRKAGTALSTVRKSARISMRAKAWNTA